MSAVKRNREAAAAAEILFRALVSSGMSMVWLASETGLSEEVVGKIVRGERKTLRSKSTEKLITWLQAQHRFIDDDLMLALNQAAPTLFLREPIDKGVEKLAERLRQLRIKRDELSVLIAHYEQILQQE